MNPAEISRRLEARSGRYSELVEIYLGRIWHLETLSSDAWAALGRIVKYELVKARLMPEAKWVLWGFADQSEVRAAGL